MINFKLIPHLIEYNVRHVMEMGFGYKATSILKLCKKVINDIPKFIDQYENIKKFFSHKI